MTERERLQQLLTFMQRLSDDYWNTLSEPVRLMADGAWVGPTARGYTADQEAKNRMLHAALRDAVNDIKQALAKAG